PWKRLYNSVMARGDVVIANSVFIRDHVYRTHRTPADRLIVIPRGVDLAQFDPDATPDERVQALRTAWGIPGGGRKLVALLPGRLSAWKGQHVLIEAAYNLKEAGQEEDFLFILAGGAQGSGSYGEALKRRIKERRVGNMVKMVGHCADMQAAIAVSDVVVSTSLRPEAFGRVAVEAQAMGRPAIATDHGGARETVLENETGWLTPPGDAGALAAALSRFAGLSGKARAEIGAAGRKRVAERFDNARMCADTLSVYERVLSAAREAAR
ncbi:MAG: glycosyltransferase, partial [Pseudomonadota bacterium]